MNNTNILRKLIFLLSLGAPLFAAIPKQNRPLIYNTTITGIVIVLFALLVVAISVAVMSQLIKATEQQKIKREENIKLAQKGAEEPGDDDTVVAIATALHLEMRSRAEDQKAILTITKALRPFSGWNNKAYGMRSIQQLKR